MPRFLVLALACLLPFSLSAAPAITAAGIVNSADYGSSISTGSIISIYGTELAPQTAIASEKPLPTVLAGVSVLVTVDGAVVEAPLFFVSMGQINAQMPYGTGGKDVDISIRTNDGVSNAVRAGVGETAPRFYTKTMDGAGEAILVHHPSYELVAAASPAVPEEVVILYMSGLGEVNPAVAAGTPAGNGAGGGPLNSVVETVEVWIGGQKATVYWAGLAPDFAGLYQVNFGMPAALPDGMTEIEVRCGGGRTQAQIMVATASRLVQQLAPDEVVRLSLEAQSQGDIDKMFSYWALDEYDPAAVADGQAALKLLRDGVSFTNFEFKPTAVGYGDQGNVAVVRAEVSFTMAAPGLNTTETVGVFATLVGGAGQWKILAINPDDLLNMVIYDREQAAGAGAQSLERRHAGLQTPEEASRELDYTIINTAANEGKMAADGIMSRVGAVPGSGDAAAEVYQMVCVGWDTCETVEEFDKRGFTTVFFLNLSQVAVGIVQIAVEPIPGVDTAADMVQLFLERTTSMHELRRGVKELAAAVRTPRKSYNAWLFLPAESKWARPEGFEESESPDVEVAYGRPLQAIGLTKRECIDKPIPFVVVGEVPLPSGLEKVAEKLGARRVGGSWKLPLDITTLARYAEDVSEGEEVLQSYRMQRGPKGTGLVVAWKSTCVRGYQKLKVPLANGEIAFGPEVVNKFMNLVQGLEIPELEEGKLKVRLEERKPFRVIGKGGAGSGDIDLSTKFECLEMSVAGDGYDLVNLWRTSSKLELEGEKAGATTLEMTLPGPKSKNAHQFPDIESVTPIQVGDAVGGSSWQNNRTVKFYNDQWQATFNTQVSTTGKLVECTGQEGGFLLYLVCGIPAADTDPPVVDSYTITVNVSGVAPIGGNQGPPDGHEMVVYGQFVEGSEIKGGTGGGTFTTNLQIPRGPGEYRASFGIIIKYKNNKSGEETWQAGENVFTFYVRR